MTAATLAQIAVDRFVERVTPFVPDGPALGERLAVARAAFPEPMAALDALVAAAEKLFPIVVGGHAAIYLEGWREQTIVRIGVNGRPIEFWADRDELMWCDTAGRSYVLRPDGSSPDGEHVTFTGFAMWLADEFARALHLVPVT